MACRFRTSRPDRRQRFLWLLLLCGGLCSALDAQVVALPPPTGVTGELIVTGPPAQDVVIYHTGLLGLINKARLVQIELQITALEPPLVAALEKGDFKNLVLVESTNHVYGDADDVVLNTLQKKDIVVDGGVTVINDKGNATPVGLFPLPVGELLRHYFVVARISASAKDGHAFRVGAAPGHITMSTPPPIGQPVWASNDDRVVIGGLPADPPIVVAQPDSLGFDTVAVGHTDTLQVTLSNSGAVIAAVSGVTVDNDQFTVAPEVFSIDPGDQQVLSIVHTPTGPGPTTGLVSVQVVGLQTPLAIRLSGYAVGGGLTLSTNSVDFGLVTYGQTGSVSLELSNPGGTSIAITDLSISDSQFSTPTVPFALGPGQTAQVPVSFAATSLGTKTAILSIQHEGDLDPVEVVLQADATVSLGKANVNFGQIAPGATAILPVRIDNPSAADVTITSIVSDNPRFVPAASSCVVPAGGFHDVMIAFTPIDGTRQEAQLAITHNPTVFVGVVANGFGQGGSPGVDAGGKPLKTFAVPFGGELLASLLICLYARHRRSR